jgi:hypothetical protein
MSGAFARRFYRLTGRTAALSTYSTSSAASIRIGRETLK